MKRGKQTGSVLTAAFLIGLPVLPAFALEPSDVLAFSFGHLILRPQFEIRERYDSNLFYQAQDEVSDFITDFMPGIDVFFGERELNFLSFGYVYDQAIFAETEQLNSDNHLVNFSAQLKGSRWSLSGADSIQLLASVLSGSLNFNNKPVERVIYSDNYTLTYLATEKTSVYLTGAFDATDYAKDTSLLDYNALTGTGGFEFKAFAKTGLFGEVYYGQSATDPNRPFSDQDLSTLKGPHAEFIGSFLGVKGNFTPKLAGQVKVGYEVREFSNGDTAGSGIVALANLTHQFSEKTSFALSYTRRPGVSVQYGTSAYVLDVINLTARQIIGTTGKWVARASVGYEVDAYQGDAGRGNVFANRLDSLYTVSAGLDYLIQLWLTAGVSYEFYKFESNLSGNPNYDVHRLGLRLSVGY